MLTCCPACRTCFRITEAQLAMAQGKVRCGKCKTVFNARQHLKPLSGQDPKQAPAADTALTTPPGAATDDTNYIDLGPAPPATRAGTPEPAAETKPEPAFEPAPEAEPSASRYQYNNFTDDIISEQELDDILAEMNQQLSLGIDSPAPDTDPLVMPRAPAPSNQHDELSEAIDSLFDDAHHEEPPPGETAPEVDDESGTEFVGEAEPVDRQASRKSGEKPDAVAGPAEAANPSADDAVPLRLRDSLAIQPPGPRSWLATLGGGVLLLLLLAILAGQLILFRPLDVVRWLPQSQPYLEQLCQQLPCHVLARREPVQFRLLDRDVRAHPEQDKTLLITASLINQAGFAQAYPDLQVTLFDLSGNPVARRRFAPTDYLGERHSPFMQLQPDTPLHIKLEVVDPGSNAVNFEFDIR